MRALDSKGEMERRRELGVWAGVIVWEGLGDNEGGMWKICGVEILDIEGGVLGGEISDFESLTCWPG